MLRFPFKGSVSVPQTGIPTTGAPVTVNVITRGRIREIKWDNPAAGANATFLTPAGFLWKLQRVFCRFIPAPLQAANRVLDFGHDQQRVGAAETACTSQTSPAVHTIPAVPASGSVDVEITWATGYGAFGGDVAVTDSISAPLCGDYVYGNTNLFIFVKNRQTSDQIDRIRMAVEEWVEESP